MQADHPEPTSYKRPRGTEDNTRELLFKDTNFILDITDGFGTPVQGLLSIPQGVEQNQRVGSTVRIHRVGFRLKLSPWKLADHQDDSSVRLRIIMFWDLQPNGSDIPDSTLLLQLPFLDSFYHNDNLQRFHILTDTTYDFNEHEHVPVNAVAKPERNRTIVFSKAVKKLVRYSNEELVPENCNLCLLIITDQGTTHTPTVSGTVRVNYTDK